MVSNQPTPEFREHHDVEPPRVDDVEFRQGWRVNSRLDQLRAAGRITRDEWQAAIEYRTTWGIAREIGSREPGMIRIASSGSEDAGVIARLDAAVKLRIVEDAIGKLATALLVAAVVLDRPWADTARRCQRDPHTVRDWTVFAIRALARAWAGATRRRGPRPLQRRPESLDAL